MTSLDVEKPKRKRGRPRKNLQQPTTSNIKEDKDEVKQEINYEEEIILQLPITSNDIKKFNKNSDNSHDSDKEEDNNIFEKVEHSERTNNIFTIDDITHDESSDSSKSMDCSNDELLTKLKNKDKLIKNLRDELTKMKNTNFNSDSATQGTYTTKVHKMNLDLVKQDGSPIGKTNNISCWYCTHSFNTPAYFLPDTIHDGKCCVMGCFCSPNCAAAYNVRRINDYKVFERNSLLKKLYNIETLALSPKPEVLQKFGGPISIDEFRSNNITNKKEYNFILPPLVSIIPLVEEGNYSRYKSLNNNSETSGLRLKRSKPLPGTKNSLMETMGLRKKKSKKR
tara:strand:+ start:605 stop:1618 length:1014 start_codon:yes stop_codon:yes gene_type:complete